MTGTIPHFKICKWLLYLTGNNYEKKEFIVGIHRIAMILNYVRLIGDILTLTSKFAEWFISMEEVNRFLIVSTMDIYFFGMIVNAKRTHKEAAELIQDLKCGLSSDMISGNTNHRWHSKEARQVIKTIRNAGIVILINACKVLTAFIIWPMLFSRQAFDSTMKYVSKHLGWSTSNEELLYPVFICMFLGSRFTYGLLVHSYHTAYQMVLVDGVAFLRIELKVLADSVVNIDERARELKKKVLKERLESGECISPELEDNINRSCLMECFRQSARHHQKIIE